MNTTRIQIAELIKPYMEKEYEFENLIIEKYVFLKNYEILWPEQCTYFYDITAVLKYIENIRKAEICLVKDKFIINIPELQEVWYLSNKPLHLYDANEEDNLLALLKKIWQTK